MQVRCCGICHTDLHIVEGDLSLPCLPIIPGHQIVGFVEARGSHVRTHKEGDRVGIPWLHSTDGTCYYCRHGSENLCDNAQFTGFHVDGGYAEFAVVGEDFAYRIPDTFSDEHAAPLLCAGIVGYRSYRISGARAGDRLGLYGFGASAHRNPARCRLGRPCRRQPARPAGLRNHLRPCGIAGSPRIADLT